LDYSFLHHFPDESDEMQSACAEILCCGTRYDGYCRATAVSGVGLYFAARAKQNDPVNLVDPVGIVFAFC
jgi:hypothetical protein